MSFIDDIGDALSGVLPILARVAPTLATAIGGPLAGTAVQFLETALGLAPGSGPAAVSAALITATPDQLAAVQKAGNDFAIRMRELDISVEKLDYDDRANARQRETVVKDSTPARLAYFVVFGAFGSAVAILLGYAQVDSTIAGVIIGYLFNEAKAATSYYFGSSQGSQAKDALLAAAAPAGAPVRPLAP